LLNFSTSWFHHVQYHKSEGTIVKKKLGIIVFVWYSKEEGNRLHRWIVEVHSKEPFSAYSIFCSTIKGFF
jgi:hypothetical protein